MTADHDGIFVEVWGPPDLVADVLSQRTENRDRNETLGWYLKYGARECWLVDLYAQSVTVVEFTKSHVKRRTAINTMRIISSVLPQLETTAYGLFLD